MGKEYTVRWDSEYGFLIEALKVDAPGVMITPNFDENPDLDPFTPKRIGTFYHLGDEEFATLSLDFYYVYLNGAEKTLDGEIMGNWVKKLIQHSPAKVTALDISNIDKNNEALLLAILEELANKQDIVTLYLNNIPLDELDQSFITNLSQCQHLTKLSLVGSLEGYTKMNMSDLAISLPDSLQSIELAEFADNVVEKELAEFFDENKTKIQWIDTSPEKPGVHLHVKDIPSYASRFISGIGNRVYTFLNPEFAWHSFYNFKGTDESENIKHSQKDEEVAEETKQPTSKSEKAKGKEPASESEDESQDEDDSHLNQLFPLMDIMYGNGTNYEVVNHCWQNTSPPPKYDDDTQQGPSDKKQQTTDTNSMIFILEGSDETIQAVLDEEAGWHQCPEENQDTDTSRLIESTDPIDPPSLSLLNYFFSALEDTMLIAATVALGLMVGAVVSSLLLSTAVLAAPAAVGVGIGCAIAATTLATSVSGHLFFSSRTDHAAEAKPQDDQNKVEYI